LMPRFRVGFPLRCFQRLSLIAWLPSVPCRTTGKPEATDPRSSRTEGSFPSGIKHVQRRETNLSHDGLNPSHDPL